MVEGRYCTIVPYNEEEKKGVVKKMLALCSGFY